MCNVMHCTAMYYTVMYCNEMYCNVMYCNVMHCTAMHYTVMYCNVMYLISDRDNLIKVLEMSPAEEESEDPGVAERGSVSQVDVADLEMLAGVVVTSY